MSDLLIISLVISVLLKFVILTHSLHTEKCNIVGNILSLHNYTNYKINWFWSFNEYLIYNTSLKKQGNGKSLHHIGKHSEMTQFNLIAYPFVKQPKNK